MSIDDESYFFDVVIDKLPNIMQQKEIYINGERYIWYSYNELKNDERIQKINGDIVQYIKELKM